MIKTLLSLRSVQCTLAGTTTLILDGIIHGDTSVLLLFVAIGGILYFLLDSGRLTSVQEDAEARKVFGFLSRWNWLIMVVVGAISILLGMQKPDMLMALSGAFMVAAGYFYRQELHL